MTETKVWCSSCLESNQIGLDRHDSEIAGTMSLVEHIPIVEPWHSVPRVQVEQDADDGGREADEGERKVPRVVVRLEALQLHDPGRQFNIFSKCLDGGLTEIE